MLGPIKPKIYVILELSRPYTAAASSVEKLFLDYAIIDLFYRY